MKSSIQSSVDVSVTYTCAYFAIYFSFEVNLYQKMPSTKEAFSIKQYKYPSSEVQLTFVMF